MKYIQLQYHLVLVVLILFVVKCAESSEGIAKAHSNHQCPLWHIKKNNKCICGATVNGIVKCEESNTHIKVAPGHCMTWNNTILSAEVNRCPFSHQAAGTCQQHRPDNTRLVILTNISGSERNSKTCGRYNRQGTRCSQCLDGYGPAAFSDGFSCADCSKYKNLWVANLFFQLSMVTLFYLAVILLQIKGTSSPLNVLIMYNQLFVNAAMDGIGIHVQMLCFIGPNLTAFIFTLLSVWNLDFLRVIIPPLCINTSLKSINTLLFEYIVAFYPFILTIFIYVCINLQDRYPSVTAYLTIPVKKFFRLFRKDWNPRATIVNACATFILLSYSKLLFVSVNLIFGIRSYNSYGEVIPGSTILLFDPTIGFFHLEHVPYAVLALSIILIFILLPPILLLLYPTQAFKKCLSCCGFTRWDIIHVIADCFHGWYKDGTDGTLDYRPISAVYLLLRVALSSVFIGSLMDSNHDNNNFWVWYSVAISHIFLGTFFLVMRPYKKLWMNHFDGLVILSIGVLLLIETRENQQIFLLGFAVGMMIVVCLCLYCMYHKCQQNLKVCYIWCLC